MWCLFVGSVHAMGLEEALDAAVARSPSADLAAARVAEAEARVREARGHLLPSATIAGGAVVQRKITVNLADNLPDIPLIDPTQLQPLVVVPQAQLQARAEVVQPLVAPAAWAGGAAAREGVALARADGAVLDVQVQRAVVGAWHASAEAHALVGDAAAGVELAQRLLERGRALVDAGVASEDQLLGFQRAEAVAEGNLAVATVAAEAADGVLDQLTGLDGAADGREPPADVPDLAGLLARMDRADLEQSRVRVVAAEAGMRVEERSAWPILAARGSVAAATPAPDLGAPVVWNVQLAATVPLLQGGVTRARVAGADERVAQASAAVRAARELAEIEVRRAHGDLARAIAALASREKALDLAEQAVAAAERRLGDGGGSLLAVQQAQAEQIVARAELTRARADASRAADLLDLAVIDRR
ncbi:MAG: TolC family protein [Alphaproteobacteria bacterium]|nr:TolC family protein [Alphaproteobacteria bacterium]